MKLPEKVIEVLVQNLISDVNLMVIMWPTVYIGKQEISTYSRIRKCNAPENKGENNAKNIAL